MRKLFLLAIAIIFFSTLYGQSRLKNDTAYVQPELKFDQISLIDGLSQSSITCIIQDHKGFMWFGTLDGLNKYDGYGFKVYRNEFMEPNSIADNSITALCEDKNHTLWIGTKTQGVCYLDKIKECFVNLRHLDDDNSLTDNNVKCMYVDDDNVLWVGTENGLTAYDIEKETYTRYYHKKSEANSLTGNVINHITADTNGKIWLATNNGFDRIDPQKQTVKGFHLDSLHRQVNCLLVDRSKLWIASNQGLFEMNMKNDSIRLYTHDSLDLWQINALALDGNDTLWIGSNNSGLGRLDIQKNRLDIFRHHSAKSNSISVNTILNIYLDRTRILWLGTSLGGINKWNRAAEELNLFRHNPYERNSLSDSQVRSIYQDKQGDIWVGTVHGGLNQWVKERNMFESYEDKNDKLLKNSHIRSIYEDDRGNFWLGTAEGGLLLFDRESKDYRYYRHREGDDKSLSHNSVWRIMQDHKGVLWIATFGGGLNKFDYETETFTAYTSENTDLPVDKLVSIFEDRQNKLWIATFGGGLVKWDETRTKMTVYNYEAKNDRSIGSDRIYCLMEGADGTIWIGTKGGGLNRYCPEKDDFRRYTTKDGLPNNVVMGIVEDNNGYLWFSTNSGLSRFKPNTMDDKKAVFRYDYWPFAKNGREAIDFRNFDMRDGLQSNEFLIGSYCKSHDGEIFFGGIDGFNAFYPENIKDNQHKPKIVITGFQIIGQEAELDTSISEKKLIELTWRQNSFSFDFVALDYVFPEKNLYAYKMIGFDDDFNYVQNRRFASYTNMPPGEYTFKVIGSNNDQVWNEEGTEIRVLIQPAFWQTTWFKIAIIAIPVLILIGIFLGIIKGLQAHKRYLERVVAERTAEIRKQNLKLEEQNEEIRQQRDHIMDSIFYAKRIQTAALPSQDDLNAISEDHFVLFKPRDVVSGDFYWVTHVDNKSIIIAADCTGHGVPGAFMSMLGISFLNKIVKEKKIYYPTEILNLLRNNIVESLRQTGAPGEAKDGMDLALVVIDSHEYTLEYAGANNPLYLIRDGEAEVIKADKMPIAIFEVMNEFKTHRVKLQKNDTVYIFSDGYPDQFGGPKNKKFMYGKFRKLLLKIADKPMNQQRQILEETIENWMAETEQIDDILVMGVKVS